MSKIMNGYINTKHSNDPKHGSKHGSKHTSKHSSKHGSKHTTKNKIAPTNLTYKSKGDNRTKIENKAENKSKVNKTHKNQAEYEDESIDNNEVNFESKNDIDETTLKILKKKITDWVDYDDKIKELATKAKQYKDAKKKQEEFIINMIIKLEMIEDSVFDVHDKKNNIVRGRVYPYKSVTKEALSNDIIKNALMEVVHNEKQVDLLIKKIDNKRPIKERYYLKRTTGNKIG
jgi:hypothetical protein